MSGYDGVIRIITQINTSDFTRALTSINNSINGAASKMMNLRSVTDSATKSARTLRSAFSSIAGILGSVFSVIVLTRFGKSCIELASDLQEVDNVVSKSFGNMRGEMDALADSAIKNLGMSRLTAYKTGSTFMSMGKSMLDSQETAKNMALELTKLTANMSSFFNVSQELAQIALNSIYTGETETLKQYGVVMTEVNLKQFAMEKGIKKTYSEMSQSEKVMLRYQYVMDQLNYIGNDFIDTQDSWANQTRILTEQWHELMTIIGNGLVTVLTPVVKVLNKIIETMIRLGHAIGTVLSKVFGIQIQSMVPDTADGTDAIGGMTDAMDEYGDAAEKAGKKAKGAVQGFEEINNISSSSSKSGGSGGSGFDIRDDFEVAIEETESAIDETASRLEKILKDLFTPFKDAWNNVGQEVMDAWEYALKEVWNLIKDIGSDFLKVWKQPETEKILENILHIIADIGKIIGNLAHQFDEAWKKNKVGLQIFENIRDIIGIIIEHIKAMADATVEWSSKLNFTPLLEAFNSLLESLKPVVDNIMGVIEDFYTTVILPLASWTIETGIPELMGVFQRFNEKVDWVGLRENLAKLWEHLEPFAERVGEGLILFIEDCAQALAEFINSEAFESFLENIGKWMDSVDAEDVADALKGIATAIVTLKAALTGFKIAAGFVSFLSLLKKIAGLKGVSTVLHGIASGIAAVGGIQNLFTLDMAALAAEGGFATAGTVIGTAIIGGIIAAFAGWNFGQWLNEQITGEEIELSFSEQMSEIKDSFTDGSWKEAIQLWGDDIKGGLKAFGDDVNKWMEDTFGEWAGITFADIGAKMASLWNENIVPWFTQERWSKLWDDVKAAFLNKWEEIKEWWGNTAIVQWWENDIAPWFTQERWSKLWDDVKAAFLNKWEEIKEWWNNTAIIRWWEDNVEPWFTEEKWSFTGIKDGLKTAWESAVQAVKDVWNSFANWANSNLKFTIDPIVIMGKTVFEGTTIDLGKIPTLANGGITTGSTLANIGEAGREAVLPLENNLGYLDGFAQKIADKINRSNNKPLVVYLDGKEVFNSVQTYANEHFRTTGNPAFDL